jgi:hypothetical protein
LRLYMMSCWRRTLYVLVVPHLFQSLSRPSAACRYLAYTLRYII